MKFRNLNKWDNPTECCGLVYFAQMLEEMLFELSLDTYKPSVLHTGLLCSEASDVIRDIKLGNIKEPNIWHVLAELCKNLETDIIAQNLLKLSPASIYPTLKGKSASLSQIETVVELMKVSLNPIDYRKKNEELIAIEMAGEQRFSEIRRLTRSYVTHLVERGFHPKYIHEQAHEYFWYGPEKISTSLAIVDFFKIFPAENCQFEVVFKVDPVLGSSKDVFSAIGINFSNTLDSDFDISSFPDFIKSYGNFDYVLIKNLEAKDIFRAREQAEDRLKTAATLYAIYHHSTTLNWAPVCIVKRVDSGEYRKMGGARSPMQKCADVPAPIANRKLKSLINGFSLERDSFAKFHRSAQLHAMALESDSKENQILNIWIALESLVPSETRADNSSNIEHICSSLTHFLNIRYIDKLLDNLAKDLFRWNGSLVRGIFRNIGGKRSVEKLSRIIVLEEYKDSLIDLQGATKDFYLLRDRLDYFKSMMGTPSAVAIALDNHKQRLEWQIRRIYRARNIIVHSGTTPRYTQALIEHAHDYLDEIINSLVYLASAPKKINSVAQGFKYVELRYNEYYSNLKAKGSTFSEQNIDDLLIGFHI